MHANNLIPATSPLRRLKAQAKFLRKALVVMVPINDYLVQDDCIAALRELGHTVVVVRIGERGENFAASVGIGAMLRAVAQHKPDMMLSINYLGFDRINWFGEIIEAAGVPCAVWFVDHPFFSAYGYIAPTPSMTTFFCWDKALMRQLQALGASRVYHLPLATNKEVFKPSSTHISQDIPVSFLGHSLQILQRRWHAMLRPEEHAKAHAWATRFGKHQATDVVKALPAPKPPVDRNVLAVAYGLYVASARYRLSILKAQTQHTLHIFGDPAWRHLLPKARHHGGMVYGHKTAEIYRRSTISLNATIFQMPSAVNQRVFDVPAAGGFVLTDHQPELQDMFDLDTEVVCYDGPDHLEQLCQLYMQDTGKRRAISERAKKRILAHHLYRHRLATLVQQMRALHGPMQHRAHAQSKAHP